VFHVFFRYLQNRGLARNNSAAHMTATLSSAQCPARKTSNQSETPVTNSSNSQAASGVKRFWAWPWVEVTVVLLTSLYLLYRFFRLPLLGDEWGFLWSIYSNGFFEDIFGFRHDLFAQGEILSLLFSKLCHRLLRINEVQSIRIPTLLSWFLFVLFAWRIRRLFDHRFLGVLAFVALLTNAFVLDYFTLAQGIGMALSFLLGSLCLLIEITRRSDQVNGSNWRAHCIAWLATLMPLVHMAFMPACVGCFAMIIWLWVRAQLVQGHRSTWQWLRQIVADNHYLFAPLLVIVLMFLPRAIIYSTESELIKTSTPEGGANGFIAGMVSSLVTRVFYDIHLTTFTTGVIAWGTVLFGVTLGLTSIWKALWSRGSVVSLCLGITVLAILSAKLVLGMPYPKVRWALYLLPMVLLQALCCADEATKGWGRLFRGFIGCSLIGFIIIGLLNLNLTHTITEIMFVDAPVIVRDLEVIHRQTQQPMVLYMSDGRKWAIWYYAARMFGLESRMRAKDPFCQVTQDWLTIYEGHCGRSPQSPRQFIPQTNFFLLTEEDEPPDWVPESEDALGGIHLDLTGGSLHAVLTLVAEYPLTRTRLYKREPRKL